LRPSPRAPANSIAELLAFLVSPQAKYLTGTVVRMDGGEIKSN
jgi:3-oxoacyl-[acyl-carrier protein] reductase